MAKGNLPRETSALAADDKARQKFAERCIQIENAALVEQHGDGCGGDDLGDTGYIKHGARLNPRGAIFVGEPSKCILEDNFAPGKDSEGTTGKSVAGYRIPEYLVNRCES